MKVIGIVLLFTSAQAMSQSPVGKWQGSYQMICPGKTDSTKSVAAFSKYLLKIISHLPVTMKFKENGSVRSSLKFRGKGRLGTSEKYKYSFEGESIKLSNKKSKAKLKVYTIETLTHDSLVYHVSGRECQKTTLVRVK
jgi:hypothetical protein